MDDATCDHCGERIEGPKPWRRDYCSRACANRSKERATETSICPNCEDTFEHHESVDRTFCSTGCSNRFHHSGTDSPHYVDGESEDRPYGPNWSQQRELAMERDFYQCRLCRITREQCREEFNRDLHVHHRTPRRYFDNLKRANRLRNLLTLCPRCHTQVERRT